VLVSEAPSANWDLTVHGRSAPRATAFGVANVFTTADAGAAKVRYRTPLWRWPLAVVPFLLWAGAASVLWRSRRRPVPVEPDTQLIPVLAGAGAGA
jgi:membrane protein implicated in regulation of membrane protease activity